ncbi:MAG: hypothetical protein PHQ28_05025 [Mycobacterium sp.]|nr:hypothetical protein [Mycobacterium sp.]
MFEELDAIRASIADLEALDARQDEALDLALGIYANDPVAPTVMALVWRGRLAELKIADPVCQLPPKTAADLINAVVINAFNEWHTDYTRRLTTAAPTPHGPDAHAQ